MTSLSFIKGEKQLELPMECCRCGVCCTEYQVNVSLAEGQHIADRLGLAWKEFLESYADNSWPGVDNFLLRKRDGACIFLERIKGSKVTSCRIHAFKPSPCIDWAPSLYRRECQKGLANYRVMQ